MPDTALHSAFRTWSCLISVNRAGTARLCPERQDAVLSVMRQQLHCMKLVGEW